ncbi:hypothetical protein [Pseudarthrobacter sp. S9]|uniref:hypothetical protein n=1 Tax=Pseudarthrobacter sp. S9 TaxID=3418421 RepID=UPI003D078B47
MGSMEQWWDQLDSVTRQWLVENPGCVILPRTVVHAISTAIHGDLGEDQHGQLELSDEDRQFIRSRAGQEQADGPGIGR